MVRTVYDLLFIYLPLYDLLFIYLPVTSKGPRLYISYGNDDDGSWLEFYQPGRETEFVGPIKKCCDDGKLNFVSGKCSYYFQYYQQTNVF